MPPDVSGGVVEAGVFGSPGSHWPALLCSLGWHGIQRDILEAQEPDSSWEVERGGYGTLWESLQVSILQEFIVKVPGFAIVAPGFRFWFSWPCADTAPF